MYCVRERERERDWEREIEREREIQWEEERERERKRGMEKEVTIERERERPRHMCRTQLGAKNQIVDACTEGNACPTQTHIYKHAQAHTHT